MDASQLRITPFRPEHQDEARRLILEGLGEHWGWIDEEINEDLHDIARSYADGHFALGWISETLAATGALIPESDGVVRIVRMSVRKSVRRQGIGARMLDHLVQTARDLGTRQIVLATTETWHDVIAFYTAYGFTEIGRGGGDMHMTLGLRIP